MNQANRPAQGLLVPRLVRVLVIALLGFLAVSFIVVGIAYAGSVGLFQCENGPLGAPVDCTGNWQNGNLGTQHNHYQEGDTIPYKIMFGELEASTSYSITIGWDAIHSGRHAIDYLQTWNNTTGGDPCSAAGASTICSTSFTTTFPIASNDLVAPLYCGVSGATEFPNVQVFTLINATINSVSPYKFNAGGCSNLVGSSAQNQTTITFTTSITGGAAILLWGGHIGKSSQWGLGESAGGISGSPNLMAVVACGSSLKGCGRQDAQLSAASIASFSTSTTTAVTPSIGSPTQDSLHLVGTIAGSTISGTATWIICQNTIAGLNDYAYPTCVPTSSDTVTETVLSPVTVSIFSGNDKNPDGIVLSPPFTPRVNGAYCWMVSFNGSTGIYPTFNNVTDIPIECFRINSPTVVTLTDFSARAGEAWLPLALSAAGMLILATLAVAFTRRQS